MGEVDYKKKYHCLLKVYKFEDEYKKNYYNVRNAEEMYFFDNLKEGDILAIDGLGRLDVIQLNYSTSYSKGTGEYTLIITCTQDY